MSSKTKLYDWLRVFDLSRFYPRFTAAGIDEASFLNLDVPDYKQFGVVTSSDKSKLQVLIHLLKSEGEEGLARYQESRSAAKKTPTAAQPAGQEVTPSPAKGRERAAERGSERSAERAADRGADRGAGERQSFSQKHRGQKQAAGAPPPASAAVAAAPSRASVPPVRSAPQPTYDDDVPAEESPRDRSDDEGADRRGSYVAVNSRGGKDRIRVCVRKRPLSKEELSKDKDIINCNGSNSLVVNEPKVRVDMTRYIEEHEFIFDEVFHEQDTNEEIYRRCCRSLIGTVFSKGRATCFAYGQTGSGKTYTMMGSGRGDGLYMQAARDIFAMLHAPEHAGKYAVWVSFFEIYSGTLYDLLNDRKKLFAREDANQKVVVMGLQEQVVEDENHFMRLMDHGNTVRSTAATGANADSSRSHAILQIVLKASSGKEQGRLSFIDLAGSERAGDTMDNDRQRRLEGAEINKSLLALKECIRALDQEKSHKPFRQSKLTQVLKDSFMGRESRTVMIANISPNSASSEHTLNTLRYADRVKELKRAPGAAPVQRPPSPQNARGAAAPPPRSAADGRDNGARSAYPPLNAPGAAAPAPAPAPSRGVQKDTPDRAGKKAAGKENRKAAGGGGAAAAAPPPRSGAGDRASQFGYGPDEGAEAQELVEAHAELVSNILAEKEDIILAHRQQIDDMMEIVKQEMKLLHSVDQPGSAVDDYVAALDELLNRKAAVIGNLRGALANFQNHLKQEEVLSKSLERSLPRPRKNR